MVREIALTNGMVTLVDDEDYERLAQYQWSPSEGRHGCFYAARVVTVEKNGRRHKRTVQMQREILDPDRTQPRNRKVDHRDGVTLTNLRSNLRWANDSQSNANRRLFKNNTTGFRGVYGPDKANLFIARIRVNGKIYHLGYYRTTEAAAERYNFFAADFFGEFARLNVIPPSPGVKCRV